MTRALPRAYKAGQDAPISVQVQAGQRPESPRQRTSTQFIPMADMGADKPSAPAELTSVPGKPPYHLERQTLGLSCRLAGDGNRVYEHGHRPMCYPAYLLNERGQAGRARLTVLGGGVAAECPIAPVRSVPAGFGPPPNPVVAAGTSGSFAGAPVTASKAFPATCPSPSRVSTSTVREAAGVARPRLDH